MYILGAVFAAAGAAVTVDAVDLPERLKATDPLQTTVHWLVVVLLIASARRVRLRGGHRRPSPVGDPCRTLDRWRVRAGRGQRRPDRLTQTG